MDSEYIVPKLLSLSKLMYSPNGEPFAKYSKQRDLYIFGCIHPFGEVVRNVVHKSVAIYLVCHTETKKQSSNHDKRQRKPSS